MSSPFGAIALAWAEGAERWADGPAAPPPNLLGF
jgi:hypothetical protein